MDPFSRGYQSGGINRNLQVLVADAEITFMAGYAIAAQQRAQHFHPIEVNPSDFSLSHPVIWEAFLDIAEKHKLSGWG